MDLQAYLDLGIDAREFNGKGYLMSAISRPFLSGKIIERPLGPAKFEKFIKDHEITVQSLPKFPIGGKNFSQIRWEVKIVSPKCEVLCDFRTASFSRQFTCSSEWQNKHYRAGEVICFEEREIKTVHDQDIYKQNTKHEPPQPPTVMSGLAHDANCINDYPDLDDFANELCNGSIPVSEAIQSWVDCQRNKKKLFKLLGNDAEQWINLVQEHESE